MDTFEVSTPLYTEQEPAVADDDKKTDEQREAEAAVVQGPRSMVVPGNDLSGYIGTAPEYMNYADPTHKPYVTEEEAYMYTNLTNDQVFATRDRESEFENEKPAVAEDTGYDFKADEERRKKEEAEAEKEQDENDSGDTKTDGDINPEVANGTQSQEVGPVILPENRTQVQRPPLGSS